MALFSLNFKLLGIVLSMFYMISISSGASINSRVNCSEGSYQPHDLYCDWYYKCTNGVAVPLKCPTGLHYSASLQVCVLPEFAECTILVTTTETPETEYTSTEINETTYTTEEDEFSTTNLVETSTSENNVSISDETQTTTQETETSDTTEAETTTEYDEGSTSTTNSIETTTPYENTVTVSDATETTAQGTETSVTTDNTTESDETTVNTTASVETTTVNDNTSTNSDETETTAQGTETSVTTENTTEDDETTVNSTVSLETTTEAETTTQETETSTTSEVTTEYNDPTETTTLADVPVDCPPLKPLNEICRNNDTYYYPHPYDCSKYVHCAYNEPYVRQCPDGLLWHHKYKTCDWYYEVKCCQNSAFQCPPQTSLEYICNDGQTHHPHPTNCSKFIKCQNNRPYVKQCFNGLLWNPKKGVCDWPDKVTCCHYQF